jgi:hypothetical protein
MSKTKTAAAPMPDFGHMFAADLEAETVPFRIAGRDAWVKLKPMDFNLLVEFNLQPPTERVNFMLRHTLLDWHLWALGGYPLDPSEPRVRQWEQFNAPDDPAARARILEQGLSLSPEAGNWLVAECMRVNGQTPEAQGN